MSSAITKNTLPTKANRLNTARSLSSRKVLTTIESDFSDIIALSKSQAIELGIMREKLRTLAADVDASKIMSDEIWDVLGSTEAILESKVSGIFMESECVVMLEKFKKDVVEYI